MKISCRFEVLKSAGATSRRAFYTVDALGNVSLVWDPDDQTLYTFTDAPTEDQFKQDFLAWIKVDALAAF